MITHALLRQLLDYDKRSGDLTWLPRPRSMFKSDQSWKTWNTRYAGKRAFTSKSDGYLQGTILGQRYTAHRVIWFWVHGYWPEEVDHADRTRDNNSLRNLREVTSAENKLNVGDHPRNTSGYKGVTWHQHAGKWMAQISRDGRRRCLGYFDDPGAAHLAYLAAV